MPSPITLTGSTPFTNPAGTTITAATTDIINNYTIGADFTFTNAGVLIDTDGAVNGQGAAIYLVAGNNFGAMPVNLITNTGSIHAYGYGMRLIAESGQTNPVVVENSGTIIATGTQGNAAGIITDQNVAGTVINAGDITGGDGIFLQGNFNGTLTAINLAGGTITGTEAVTNGIYGVRIQANQGGLQGTGIIVNYGLINGIAAADVLNPTIINGGTIDGQAYALGAGTLVLDPGEVIDGGVLFSDQNSAGTNNAGGSSTIVLAGTGPGTLAHPGAYVGFGALDIAAGADWTLGNTTSSAGITGITTVSDLGTLNFAGDIAGTTIVAEPDATIQFTGVNAGNSFSGPGSGAADNATNPVTDLTNGDRIVIGPGAFDLNNFLFMGENDGTTFGQAVELIDQSFGGLYVPYSGTAGDPLTYQNLAVTSFGGAMTLTVVEANYTFTGNGDSTLAANYAGGAAPPLTLSPEQILIVASHTDTIDSSTTLTNNSAITITGGALFESTSLAGIGSVTLENGGQLTLANTLGTDSGQTVSFSTGGTSLALNTLDLSGTSAGFGGTIAGFGTNDAIILGGSVLPTVGLGGTVSLGYAGSLLTVAELNAAGSITASTTLDVGTGYSASGFVALLGTAGVAVETTATVDEAPLTFTGTGSTTSFEDPTNYVGGLAPGNSIIAGETVLVTAPATLSSATPLTNTGTIIASGSHAAFLDTAPLAGTGTLLIANSGAVTLANTLGTDAGQTVSFSSGGTSLALNTLDLSGTSAGFGGTIAGFGANDAIILGGSLLPSLGLGGTVSLSYAGSLLIVAEVNSAGTVTASTTLDVGTGYSAASFAALSGTAGVVIETPASAAQTPATFTGGGNTANFLDPSDYAGGIAPGNTIAAGQTVLVTAPATLTSTLANNGTIIESGTSASFLALASLSGTGTLAIENSGQVTLASAPGTDAGQTVAFGSGGTSLALNTLDLSGTSAGFGGTITGFGLNDAIVLTGSVLPAVGLGGAVSLGYSGSLLTVAEVNAAGSVTASTTLDVGTGYATSGFVALLGTAGVVIETPATAAEEKLTFTGTGATTSFEDPTDYAGGLAPGNSIAAGETVVVAAAATLASTSPLIDSGQIVVSGTSASFTDPLPLTGTGTLVLKNGGEATLSNTATASSTNIAFSGAGTITLDDTLAASATISNFTTGDAIIFGGLTVAAGASVTTAGTIVTIHDGPETFSLNIVPSNESFHLSRVNGSLALTATPCFCSGTRIRTDQGEVAVEDLAIGDRVITLSGEAVPVKWLGRRTYRQPYPENSADIIPILICHNALGPNLPERDLYVSPLHAMYLADVLVPAGLLVNGRSIRACPEMPAVQYVHIELERHDVIFAEGAPSETFVDCDSRAMFENAAEFAALYPEDASPEWRFCAPRLESGPALRRIWSRLAGRAGLTASPGAPPHAKLLGYVDQASHAGITGWAYLPAHPGEAVELEVLDGQGVIARILADRYRPDLAQAGIGNGRHGFELTFAQPLPENRTHTIRVRRAGGPELARSPISLQARKTAVTPRAAGGKRALVLDALWPDPARDAGSNAILSHIAGLRALGFAVDLMAVQEPGTPPPRGLAELGIGFPEFPGVEKLLLARGGDYALVYMHRLAVAGPYGALVRALSPALRIYSVTGQAGAEEVFAMRLADAVITRTAAETEDLRQAYHGINVHTVPWETTEAMVSALRGVVEEKVSGRFFEKKLRKKLLLQD